MKKLLFLLLLPLVGWGQFNPIFFAAGRVSCSTNTSDSDAVAFITATGISDATQQGAIYVLVTSLKCKGLWGKMKAIYPMVGGTSTTHKYNLKDSRDLDAAYRIVFNGAWTHSATGAKPDGSTGYADTKLLASTVLPTNNAHISAYSRTASSGDICLIGAQGVATARLMRLMPTFSTGAAVECNTIADPGAITSETSCLGFFLTTKTGITSNGPYKYFKNNVLKSSRTITSAVPPAMNVYIGALNKDNVATNFSDCEIAFATIGNTMTDAEILILYNIIQTFQTTLGRQI